MAAIEYFLSVSVNTDILKVCKVYVKVTKYNSFL